ncbi:MAG: hypothetical protein J7484_06150 [Microbacterium sp.]|nr:hypothetical protein [Microbacterium sp.]
MVTLIEGATGHTCFASRLSASRGGPSFGFGANGSYLPQPEWFGGHSVEVELGVPSSTLQLYRRALRMRRRLQTEEGLAWVETGRADVLRFVRPNGWEIVTNFGVEPFDLGADARRIVLGDVDGHELPGDSTVWIAPQGPAD